MEKKDICTLMYHDVYTTSIRDSGFNIDSNYQYKLHVSIFEEQIRGIADYLKLHNVDKDYIQLSFDDGGVSFYTIIMPILEKYGFKGFFYIATKYINSEGFLTEAMIKEMSDRGHIIGGHSHTHRQRMNDLSNADLLEDWGKCLKILADITGKECTVASLPNGFISDSIICVLKELGIKELYTSEPTEFLRINGEMSIRGRYGIRSTMNTNNVLAVAFDDKYKRNLRRKKAVLNLAKKIMGNSYIKIREIVFRYK